MFLFSCQRVSFTNPYPTKKTFHLKSNRPDLLQFKESIIEVTIATSLKFSRLKTKIEGKITVCIQSNTTVFNFFT